MSPLLSNAITITLVAYGLAMLLAAVAHAARPAAQDRVLALDLIYVIGMLIDAGHRPSATPAACTSKARC
jgi:multicomponent K+:H+ antiporter subunit F